MVHHSTLLIVLLSLSFTGCMRETNRWQETDAAAAKPEAVTVEQAGGDQRIVLFAPAALGKLADIYPDGRLELPHKMANYIDLLAKNADGRVGESLPDSGSSEWDSGRVAATRGAHLVVVTRVVDLRREAGDPDVHGATERQIAIVELRVVDIDGRIVLSRQIRGESPVQKRAKFTGQSNEPESLATWQALSTASGLVRDYLADHPELRNVPKQVVPNAINLVEVAIDSEPSKADILIDGAFRGTTPQVIPLPPGKEVTISIERQGFQPWSRKLVPVSGMKIQPALEPKVTGGEGK
ncbi:MAG: PEGA domain-containing protein [Planctomycetes bacterium]|nr:PEGA domain-containing protein [Planctomycetota bacterium]